MDPRLRTALLLSGILFCLAFGLLTLTVAVNYGFDILVAISFVVLGMILAGLFGALVSPPDE